MSRPVVYSYPPAPQDWAAIQDAIRVLYVDEKLRLKEVRAVLHKRHGFRASERMVKARLKQWGYLKNAKKEDWHFLALLHQKRKSQGLPAQVFDVRGHRKTVKDLQRFIRNQAQTYDQFLDEARITIGKQSIPDYIQPVEPGQSGPYQSSIDEDSPEFSNSRLPQPSATPRQPTDNLGHPLYLLPPADLHRRASTTHRYRRSLSDFNHPEQYQFPNMHDLRDVSTSNTINCQQVQWEFETMPTQLVNPINLVSRLGEEDIRSWTLLNARPASSSGSEMSCEYICSRCNQPSNHHFISLDNLEPHSPKQRRILNDNDETLHLPVSTKEEGPWTWLSRCFMACMLMTKGNEEGATLSLDEAAKEFERLVVRKDPLLLTAAGQLLVILHQHDQGNISRRVMEASNRVATRLLPKGNPIRLTIEYLTASTDISYEWSDITSDTLRGVVLDFSHYLPPDHAYIIAARYNYAFLLKREADMQRSGNKCETAESEFRQVLEISKKILGEIHMQTIAIEGSLAGLLALQNVRRQESMALLQVVCKQSSKLLGPNHPYPLEAKRRIADMMVHDCGHTDTTLKLYKDVLWGRVRMLGAVHNYTEGARAKYEEALQVMRLWQDGQGQFTFQHHELQTLFEPGSPDSWTRLVKKRKNAVESFAQQRRLGEAFCERNADDFDCEVNECTDDEDDDFEHIKKASASPASSNEYEAY